MPSPFKRHSASRQIQPMSQAELDASLADLEAKEAEDDTVPGFVIKPSGRGDNLWVIDPTRAQYAGNRQFIQTFREDDTRAAYPRDVAESKAREYAKQWKIPYLGER